MKAHFKKALTPLITLFDRSRHAQSERPTLHQEHTRFPQYPWDLRTIIMLFPEEAPFKILNLNMVLGLTGVPFDQVKSVKGRRPKDAFDLQFALFGNQRTASYKKYHSIRQEVWYEKNQTCIKLPGRLLFKGS